MSPSKRPTLLLFLKTRTHPRDPYGDYFTAPRYSGSFLPVLTHTPSPAARAALLALLAPPAPFAGYGGLVITSQRAVEVFAAAIEEAASIASAGVKEAWARSEKVVFVVGPATGEAVQRAIAAHFPRWNVQGQDCGHGQALATHVAEHYASPAADVSQDLPFEAVGAVKRGRVPDEEQATRAPLLFVAGETRRDTVPAALMAAERPAARRVRVDEVACYRTTDRAEFPAEFATAFAKAQAQRDLDGPPVWVVVFSPAHCGSVLAALGWDGPERKDCGGVWEDERREKGVRMASIGPTTAEWLRGQWGFEVDVCAAQPSPEGVRTGIEAWMQQRVDAP